MKSTLNEYSFERLLSIMDHPSDEVVWDVDVGVMCSGCLTMKKDIFTEADIAHVFKSIVDDSHFIDKIKQSCRNAAENQKRGFHPDADLPPGVHAVDDNLRHIDGIFEKIREDHTHSLSGWMVQLMYEHFRQA